MKKFISTIQNIFAIEELRNRIINTVFYLAVFRLGSFIVLPGVDSTKLEGSASGIFGLLDTFLGGAFSKASIFGLGIMPYISASIVLQLLTVAVPYFQKMQKEGESGRRKINQITRILTIFITLGQAVGYISTAIPAEAITIDPALFKIVAMVTLTSGTIFCMWLGEKITEKGIGNGISMLIMIGIISRLPGSLIAEAVSRGMSEAIIFVIEIVALFLVVMAATMLTQAVRRVPVQYARQVTGGKVYRGQRQYIPLKVNTSGVMPIIFAQSLMFVPGLVAGIWASENDLAATIGNTFADFTTWQYNVVFGLLIVVFTFFYTAITINPNQIADDLKKGNGFVPGVKPGNPTAKYLSAILDRITLPGALFLGVIAILPAVAATAGVGREFSMFFGGTSLLIMVGVVLDTLQQIESYLLMKEYEGMMKSGKLKDRVQQSAII